MENKLSLILPLIRNTFIHLFVTLQDKSYIFSQHLRSVFIPVTPSIPHYRTHVQGMHFILAPQLSSSQLRDSCLKRDTVLPQNVKAF